MLGRSKKISRSLTRTRRSFFGRVTELLGVSEVGDELWEELEELLIQADVGVKTTVELVERLQEQVNRARIRDAEAVKKILKRELIGILNSKVREPIEETPLLTVILIVGVNGSGKTTSIAKLAKYYKDRGKK
ncbi:MAG TPA: signal recognition particle-docking protein FtsY, partial [Anaerolineae bacterium]|nr:signal recognition particle-docking protein FtsY [Anaerolineae bacterium]